MAFFGLHDQTITIEPFSADASSGWKGAETYGTGVSYTCRIEMKARKVVDIAGNEKLSTGRAIINGDARTIGVRDRLTLPADYAVRQPPIIAVQHSPDPTGLVECTVVHF